MVTEPTLDDAADYRFDNLYRVNWIEKLPDYQYQCLHLPFYQICDTFAVKRYKASAGFSRRTAKPGAMRPDYRIPYLRRIFRIRGSRSEIMRS